MYVKRKNFSKERMTILQVVYTGPDSASPNFGHVTKVHISVGEGTQVQLL